MYCLTPPGILFVLFRFLVEHHFDVQPHLRGLENIAIETEIKNIRTGTGALLQHRHGYAG